MVRGKTFLLIGALAATTLALLAPLGILTAESPGQKMATYPYCLRFVSDTSYHAVQCPAAPSPTATPTATSTPVIPATLTPVPSTTPTPETTLPPTQPTTTSTPSPTPSPTATATPLPPKCWGTVTAGALNVRTEPYGTILGQVYEGDTLTFDAKWLDDFNDWWWRIYWLPGQDGFIEVAWVHSGWITPGDTADCSELPDVTPVVTHNAALLWHTVPGVNVGNARISYDILSDKGIGYGLKPYAGMNECIDTLNRGGTCIYRHGAPDCPQNIGSADPRQSARDFLQYGQYARDMLADYEHAYYEPLNECQFGGSQSDTLLAYIYWWQTWLDEYIAEAVARGYPKLVIPTMGPGHGEAIQYRIWQEQLNLLAANGGMMGEHAYTPTHDDGLCACDEWLACRHRKNEDWRQAEGVDIDVAITEAARGWGNDPVDVSDFVCWYEIVRGDEWLHSVALWTAGFHPTWPNANLDNYMVPIAQGLFSD